MKENIIPKYTSDLDLLMPTNHYNAKMEDDIISLHSQRSSKRTRSSGKRQRPSPLACGDFNRNLLKDDMIDAITRDELDR